MDDKTEANLGLEGIYEDFYGCLLIFVDRKILRQLRVVK